MDHRSDTPRRGRSPRAIEASPGRTPADSRVERWCARHPGPSWASVGNLVDQGHCVAIHRESSVDDFLSRGIARRTEELFDGATGRQLRVVEVCEVRGEINARGLDGGEEATCLTRN